MRSESSLSRFRGLAAASCLALSLLAGTAVADSSFTPAVQPAAIAFNLTSLDNVDTVRFAPLDLKAIAAQDEQEALQGMAPRYAIPNEVSITPDTNGTWEDLGNGLSVWRLRLTSPNAISINLGFTSYHMTDRGQMYIYNSNYTNFIRPFTADDNEEHGELWTPPVPGNEIVIEVTVPNEE
ncbi:MAG TPA: hypothetical protein ENJ06_05620, partial [Phycisphaeraceae bacterium]|nr:hypothetical protein [Phycisphaeraceae bacterium]